MSNVNEVIFDMSFQMGQVWKDVPEVVRENLMDMLNGSRGIFDWVESQAIAFEGMWVTLDEEDPRFSAYYEEVDEWFTKAFDKLVLEGYNYTGGNQP